MLATKFSKVGNTTSTIFSNMAPVKKKRVSKKTKKSWRKHIDVKDVDDFFEDLRLEERLGYKHRDKKNEDLFQIDVQGSTNNEKPSGKILYNLKQTPGSRQSLRVRERTVPKCFEILEKRSAVPDPLIKRNRVKTLDERRRPLVKKILQQKAENGILSGKEKEAIRSRQIDQEKRDNKPQRGVFDHDIWAQENNDKDLNGYAYWCTSDTVRHTLHNTGKKRKHMPSTIREKTSLVPAVEPPHPGTSYNPSVKDQREVVEIIANKEKKLKKEEKHIERVTTHMFSSLPENKIQKEWLKEMSGGLFPTKEDREVVEGDYSTVNPPVQNKKKTLQKRRKLREAEALKEQIKQKKVEKRKISDMYKLKKFKEEIKKKEEESQKNIEKRKKKLEQKPYMTKMLGKIKYEEPDVEFTRNEDLRGTLRESKPAGNLLIDRYKSLQKRNVIEPLLKQNKKKRKMKKYERESTKMGWEPKGY